MGHLLVLDDDQAHLEVDTNLFEEASRSKVGSALNKLMCETLEENKRQVGSSKYDKSAPKSKLKI